MRVVRHVFPQVRTRRSLSGKCPICHKRVTRTKTFEMTVNPYNTNADGSVKSREEVAADLKAEADAWKPDFRHNHDCSVY